jgi:amino acid transporter
LCSIIILCFVALSFWYFSRRIAHSGSAFAYVSSTLGPLFGFVVGWSLFFFYLASAADTSALVGIFSASLGRNLGFNISWIYPAIVAILIALFFSYRDLRVSARLMLVLEISSMVGLIIFGAYVLFETQLKSELSIKPFMPPSVFSGWVGVGHSLIFCILSFSGFEGAATLAERTKNPKFSIPVALFSAVIVSGLFFFFMAYTQVIGFGLSNIDKLSTSDAPLNYLALSFSSRPVALMIDAALLLSGISCVIGSATASSNMISVLGSAGLSKSLSITHKRFGTPTFSVLLVAFLMFASILFLGLIIGPVNFFGYVGTVGTLLIVIVYFFVCLSASISSYKSSVFSWMLIGFIGFVFMLWPLFNAFSPTSTGFYTWLPYVALLYIFVGIVIGYIKFASGTQVVDLTE